MTIVERNPTRDFTVRGGEHDDPFEWLLQVREVDPFWSENHPYGFGLGARG